jgi:hypothetical protein
VGNTESWEIFWEDIATIPEENNGDSGRVTVMGIKIGSTNKCMQSI